MNAFWERVDDLASTTITSIRIREVVKLYVDGFSHQDIAFALGIAPSTVRTYLDRAKEQWTDSGRLAVSRADIVRYAREDGIA